MCLNIGGNYVEKWTKVRLLCKNKIVTIFLLVIFISQNGTYLKNTPHIYITLSFPYLRISLRTSREKIKNELIKETMYVFKINKRIY